MLFTAGYLTDRSTCRSGWSSWPTAAIGLGTLAGRLADHPHDGLEDHQAAAGERLRRGDRRRVGAIFVATLLGIPVSTTHAITGAIVGVGATRRLSAVRWGVAGQIVWAWVLTIPAAAAIGAGTYWLLRALKLG